MREKWTRGDFLAAASLAVAVSFGLADHSGAILEALGPVWHTVQPFVIFAVGVFVGFAVSNAINHRKMRALEQRPTRERAASSSLDADSSPTARSPSSLEDLTNDEQEFVWRVYRKSALRVDPREESIAKALGIKGVVYRTEYPDDRFSVVALCDVMLTGKWVKIMKALDEGEAE